MQYLLSEAEYVALRRESEIAADATRTLLQNLCTRVADVEPVQWPGDDSGTPAPWGCILTVESRQDYCDECPVKDVCPYEHKHWSQ